VVVPGSNIRVLVVIGMRLLMRKLSVRNMVSRAC
jgi:hypothetical protein